MKQIKIDLSSFPPEKQSVLKDKILSLAWDNYITPGHPEILTVIWPHKEPVEKIFPEISPYLTYL